MKIIDIATLDNLSKEAQKSTRLRKNLNFHEELSDTLQRLLNAMEPGTYVRPHKHEDPDKREIFIALRGRIAVIIFDDKGIIQEDIVLNPKKGIYAIEIPAGAWHTVISLEPNSVVFEVKDGPYEPISDKNFAPWAPPEGNAESEKYIETILKSVGLFK
jgi:cupin fold WbuC family metalloprotein